MEALRGRGLPDHQPRWKGVKTLSVTEKTGNLVAILGVTDEDDLMVINKSGITIRTGADELRTMGRATQGVRLINLRKNDEMRPCAARQNPKRRRSIEGEEGVAEAPPEDGPRRRAGRRGVSGDRVKKSGTACARFASDSS